MEVIGIHGLSGCGKSTLARTIKKAALKRGILAEHIEMDRAFDGIKKRMPISLTNEVPSDNDKYLRLKNNPFNEIDNKIVALLYKKLWVIADALIIKQQVYQLYKKGYDLAIVEGVFLANLKMDFDFLMSVNCPIEKRVIRRSKREQKEYTVESLLERDKKDNYLVSGSLREDDLIYFNDGSLDNLEAVAESIFRAVKTFKK